MRERRWASAVIALTWLAESSGAQQTTPGAIASPAPLLAPALANSSAPEATVNDDPTDSADWRVRVAAARQRHADWVACVAAREPGCSDSEGPPAPDAMEPLLNDDTLINGDIVSTPKGLKVFRGQPTIPHSLADFQ
jgi:hypothetical protein